MNNFVIGVNKILKNKNFVTIVLVLVALGVLYFGYSYTIKKSTNPVNIPVAAKDIEPLTKITASDIVYKQVAASMIDENVLRGGVEGKYTKVNVTIPKGSPFYSNMIDVAENIPGNWIEMLDHDKEELGYYMSVNTETTLGNSVLPGSYIDIYMKVNDENGTLMFGKLLDNVKVLVVHDGSGNNVFTSTGNGTPSKIGFGLSKDLYILLKKAQYLNINLVIVPRGMTVPDIDKVNVRSATLRDYIDAQTIPIEEDALITEDVDQNNSNNNNNTSNNTNQEENTNIQ